MANDRPSLLVLVRHAESARNVAKKGSRFFLDDESRKAVLGVADHHVPITDEVPSPGGVDGPRPPLRLRPYLRTFAARALNVVRWQR